MAYRTTSWKNTDIGKIPSDWDLNLFKNTFTKYPTNSFTRDEMNDFGGSFQNIHYGDILTKYGAILDFNKYTVPYLNSFISKTYKTVQNGDIIIADTAEDETVGKCVEIYDLPQNIKVLSGMHTMFCRPTNYFYPRFLGYYMNSRVYHNQLLPYITGTKVSAVSKTDIDKTYILAPSIPEQQKIAEVLTGIDDLIAELEHVRDKKIAMKTGAMQELLKPRSNWKIDKLGKLANMNSGGTPSSSNPSFYNGNIPFLSISDLTNQGKFLNNTEKFITELGLTNSSARIVKKGTILYAMYASLGKCSISNIDVAISQAVLGIDILDNNKIDRDFLYYYLVFIEKDVMKFGQTGTQTNLSKKIVSDFEIPYPSDILTQRKIANTLTDMDDEISAISEKINKYKQIKSGVACELLSGRIRLVKPQE